MKNRAERYVHFFHPCELVRIDRIFKNDYYRIDASLTLGTHVIFKNKFKM